MIGGENTLASDDENLWKFLLRSVAPRALMIILAFVSFISIAISPRRKKRTEKSLSESEVDKQGLDSTRSSNSHNSPEVVAIPKPRQRIKASEGTSTQDLCWDLHTLAISGVPVSDVPGVLELANEIGANRRKIEPLCDPLTLLRFLKARDGVVKDALFMYYDTVNWRKNYRIDSVISSFGDCPPYDVSEYASRQLTEGGELPVWKFTKRPNTKEAKLASQLSFFGMLDQPNNEQDGAPVSIWRVGSVDLAGIKKAGLEKLMIQAFVAHLEDVMQSGRAASYERKRLIRGRLIIDATGTGIGIIRHLGTLKTITSLGKAHFPELNTTVTIVNAPWIFAKVFGYVSPLLTQAMRDKIVILDGNFQQALQQHSGVSVSALPLFLGGNTPDEQCPKPQHASLLI